MTETKASKPKDKYRWLKFGLIWGILMVLIMGVFEPMYYDEAITKDTLTHDALLWVSAGIVLGLVMFFITSRKQKND